MRGRRLEAWFFGGAGRAAGRDVVLVGALALLSCLLTALIGVPGFGLCIPYLELGRSLLWDPGPLVLDEYSYLLAAETYGGGRLTNPPHELWPHFETAFVLQQPTYQSKYPPAQGLWLAATAAVFGGARYGVWLGVALACAAVCWMLQAWLPRRWALLCGLLAATHAGIVLVWGGGYRGGAVAMAGGALLYGALPRLLARPRWTIAVVAGVGLAILANSRPFEGLVVSAPAVLVLLRWVWRQRRWPRRRLAGQVLAPLALVLVAAAAGMAHYNAAVTGDPLVLPYTAYLQQHPESSPFAWQKSTVRAPRRLPPPPPPDDPAQATPGAKVDTNHSADVLINRSMLALYQTSIGVRTVMKLLFQWSFYLGPLLSVALLGLWGGWNRRWVRLALATIALMLAAAAATQIGFPHYSAAMTGLVLFVVGVGLRRLRVWRRARRQTGRRIVGLLLALWCAALPFLAVVHRPPEFYCLRSRQRAALLEDLATRPGRDLVVVRFERVQFRLDDQRTSTWLYNEANIDAADVVWARELEPARNARLFEYFADRHTWLLIADEAAPRLRRYPGVPRPR